MRRKASIAAITAIGISLTIIIVWTARAASPNVSPFMGVGVAQFFDNTGKILGYGVLYTYAAGTTTQLPTYTDSTGATPNQDPVALDSSGRANIWLLSGDTYKFTLCSQNDGPYCAPGDTLFTVDNVPGSPASSSSGSTFTGVFISSSANVATGGSLRLAASDQICWRNSANSANLCFSLDSSNILGWAGGSLKMPFSGTPPCASSYDYIWSDSSGWKVCTNGGAAANLIQSGVDINASNQVTATHLASPLPIAQGGTGSTTAGSTGAGCISITGTWPNETITCDTVGVFGSATLSSDVNISGGTPVAVLTVSVTMPSAGCPCRAHVPYSATYYAGSASLWAAWINDGTNTFGYSHAGINAANLYYNSLDGSPYSPVTYANGANVTFKLYVESNNSYSPGVKASDSFSYAGATWMQVAAQSSN